MVASPLTILTGLAVCLLAPTAELVFTAAAASSDHELGVKPSSVVTLTQNTFQLAIEDAANPVWLLKFYAPWCGHCKKLEPVLDSVAGKVAGKMAIGKIDCTKADSKKLCSDHGVRGYPTLKFSIDGDIYEYPGGRSEAEILAFAERLNLPPVQLLPTAAAVLEFASNPKAVQDGVLFLAYHPQVQGETMEEKAQSTLLTQVYAQVARKGRAFGHFAILDPTTATDMDALGLVAAENKQEGTATSAAAAAAATPPFVCRIENNVPPRCYPDIEGVNMMDLISFVRTYNVPTVSQLGPSTFGKVGRRGRPLVIGVVNGEDAEQVRQTKERLTLYALSGPEAIREKYYYGWFDVNQWTKFLSQFNIVPKDSPQVFVLNVPDKTYWQNATYKLNIEEFLAAVEDGTIQSSTPSKPKGNGGIFDTVLYFINDNLPWSAALVVFVIVALGVFIAMIVSPGEDLRPPYDMQQQQQQQGQGQSASPTKNATATKDKSAPTSKKDD